MTLVAVVVGLLVGVGAGTWAATTLLAPATNVLAAPNWVLVRAENGTVGQSLQLNATVTWPSIDAITGSSSGIVTTIDLQAGAVLNAGDVLYSVDLRPTVVAEGTIPSFRDLSVGSEGQDVVQLQEFLTGAGLLEGNADGVFGSRTAAAVRLWHKQLGIGSSGSDGATVRRGDLVYVSPLPVRAAPGPDVHVGASLPEGSSVVQVLTEGPRFTVELADSQIAIVTPGTAVTLNSQYGVWRGTVTEVSAASGDEPAFALLGSTDGNPLCGEQCGALPVGDKAFVATEVEVVPARTGVVVPTAAIVTTADGATGVTLADGLFQPVVVVVSARGSTVVSGLKEGTEVRVPGDTP